MNLLSFLFRASRREFILATLASLIGGAAGVALIGLIHLSMRTPPTAALAGTYAGLALVTVGAKIVAFFILVALGHRTTMEIRLHVCRRVLATPLAQLEHVGIDAINAVLTEDVPTLGQIMLALPDAAVSVCLATGTIIYLVVVSPAFLLVIFCGALIGFATHRWASSRSVPALTRMRATFVTLARHQRGVLEGVKELKLSSSRREAFVTETLEVAARSHMRDATYGTQMLSVLYQWINVFTFTVVGVLLFVSPIRALMSDATIREAILTMFFLITPIGSIINNFPQWTKANLALKKIHAMNLAEVSRAPGKAPLEAPALVPPATFEKISFEGVTHAYRAERDDQVFVLGPIDLSLQRGEIVFLIGGNGSGKTTLAKILIGLYAPEAGSVRVDGQEVTALNREWYSHHFAVTFATPFIFDGIFEKGVEGIDARAQEYLDKLHLGGKVAVRNGMYSTTNLSQGQRKRLALFAAYVEDRPIYVFDEWAADQDPVFKEIFYSELLPELKAKGKTVFAITHDDRYFHLADRVLRLEHGQLRHD